MMLCQACNQNPATIHITEITPSEGGDGTGASASQPPAAGDVAVPPKSSMTTASSSSAPTAQSGNGKSPSSHQDFEVHEQHLCQECAQTLNLPQSSIKGPAQDLWKQLLHVAQSRRRDASVACPDCGMTLLEFRQKGRMGCPKDYEVFGAHTRELLERIHGATRHVGRAPGQDQAAAERQRRMSELQRELESAIRQEAYEQAARLRDQLKSLQQG